MKVAKRPPKTEYGIVLENRTFSWDSKTERQLQQCGLNAFLYLLNTESEKDTARKNKFRNWILQPKGNKKQCC